jgi:hypothetical protein
MQNLVGQAWLFLNQKLLKNNYYLFWLALVVSIVFACAFWLITRDNRFFSGDQAMAGIMVQDVQSLKFYSWYFYGQYYYGNLFVYVLSVLSLFTGVSDTSLYFWEFFFYALSVYLALASFKQLKFWLTPFFVFILFFFGRHLGYTYSIQGFSFVLFIVTFFFWWFKSIIRGEKKLNWLVFATTAAMTTISLWHNPLYIFILPALIIVYKWFIDKTYRLSWWHLFSSALGALLGLIPLIMATLEKNYQNLAYFQGNTTKSYIDSGGYVLRDLLFMFQYDPVVIQTKLDNLAKGLLQGNLINTSSYLTGLLILFCFLFVMLGGLAVIKRDKGLLVNYIFLAFLWFLVISKSASQELPVFASLRYAVQAYFISFITFMELFSLLISKTEKPTNHNPSSKAYFLHSALKVAAIPVLIFMLLVGARQTRDMYLLPYTGQQFNQIIYQDIKKAKIQNLYCHNYFEVCNALALWGREEGLQVQLIDEPLRNPAFAISVDRALSQGEPVYSLVPTELLPPSLSSTLNSSDTKINNKSQILGQYSQSSGAKTYYLIKGGYK